MAHRRGGSAWYLVGVLPLALAMVSALNCGDGVEEPNPPAVQDVVRDSLVLAPGEEVRVAQLRVGFQAVKSDSRCPIDVTCIWEGNAEVAIALGIGEGPSYPFVLNTSAGTQSADFSGYRVTLLELEPAPRSSMEIAPDAYRATFRIETLRDST